MNRWRRVAALLLALGSLGPMVVAPLVLADPAAAPPPSTMGSGSSLYTGDSLVSPNGSYQAVVQADGNVVIYGPSGAIWSTGTWGTSGRQLALQTDGNLVVYGSSGALWSTGTWGTAGDELAMQNDGNLVLYSPQGPLWSSAYGMHDAVGAGSSLPRSYPLLSPNGSYRAILQTDGNFVVYGPVGAVWSTGTWGTSGDGVAMQNDGNVVEYGSGGALWSTGTWETAASELVMQNDGNLVLYHADGRPAWSSKFGVGPVIDEVPRLPAGTSQIVVVQAASPSDIYPTLTTWQNDGGGWYPVFAPMAAVSGDTGWALPDQRYEGSDTTPVGWYSFGSTLYGIDPNPGVNPGYAFQTLTCGDWWDEDASSAQYNTFQAIGCGVTPPFSAQDSEALWEIYPQYSAFALINFNIPPTTGAYGQARGSGIFLHADGTGTGGTAGCVSLALGDLVTVLRWLNPARHPEILMGPTADIVGLAGS
jgi:L,D-peptidoglycan transpeptidase YkuD (ErfK/YbiS/YcfS/YnhG family)